MNILMGVLSMNQIGKTIKRLRIAKGDTQEKLAEKLHITCQAVSKWENDAASPDIALLPLIADYFGITIDELLNHKLNSYTYKERFIRLMYHSGVIQFSDNNQYNINTENFTTNAQISKIGECFADLIREKNLSFDVIMGHAYHGIAFSSAAANALYQKYNQTVSYCYDRKTPDSRGRNICGYTPKNGDKIIVIDDMIGSGSSLENMFEYLTSELGADIVAVITIIDTQALRDEEKMGSAYIQQKYNTKVYTLVTDEDIRAAQARYIL